MTDAATMDLESVHIVLVRPRRALNLGGVARAMKNFGLTRLTLVASQIGSWADAWRMAVKADDVLHATKQTDSLDEALKDATWIVGTTDRARAGQRLLSPRELAEEARERGAPTILFGDENNGLGNQELLRCHDVATIATAKEQSSLNLAQAVLLFAHELFVAASAKNPAPTRSPALEYASDELLSRLSLKLEQALASSAWSDADRGRDAILELVQPIRRSRPSTDEVLAWLVALGKIVQR